MVLSSSEITGQLYNFYALPVVVIESAVGSPSNSRGLMKILTMLALVPFFSFAASEVRFNRACEPGQVYLVGAVGDVLLHGPLQRQAAAQRSFQSLWTEVLPYIHGVNIAYANLEGPAARGVLSNGRETSDPGWVFDGNVYSGYPMFNYPAEVAQDLKDSGFDVVSTANNHSLDRRALGIDRTNEALAEAMLPFTGTRARGATHNWGTVIVQNGLRVGWLACTFLTNGIPDPANQVLECLTEKPALLQELRRLRGVSDFVVVTPHWGDEYQPRPNAAQTAFGRELINAGAGAVIGTHPHVVQPMEKFTATDGREGLIVYSTGNFVSNQGEVEKQAAVMVFLGLTKTGRGVHANGVKLLPLRMHNRGVDTLEVKPIGPERKNAAHLNVIRAAFAESDLVYPGQEIDTNAHCPPARRRP